MGEGGPGGGVHVGVSPGGVGAVLVVWVIV